MKRLIFLFLILFACTAILPACDILGNAGYAVDVATGAQQLPEGATDPITDALGVDIWEILAGVLGLLGFGYVGRHIPLVRKMVIALLIKREKTPTTPAATPTCATPKSSECADKSATPPTT